MPAYVITKAIWDAVQKTTVANNQVSGLLSDASYVVVDCDTDSEFRTLPAEVIPAITITKAPSEAGLDGLVAGMTAAEVLAAWTGRPLATVSNGKDPHYTHAVRIDGAQVTDLTATANLTIATTVSAAGAEDIVVATKALSVAAKVIDPVEPVDPVGSVVPDMGPYTLKQVEALRTDGTTRGVPAGMTLKVPGKDPLPAGMSRNGNKMLVAAGADIASLNGWNFTGYEWTIKGRIRSITNCVFGFESDLGLALFDLYPESHIDKIVRCSFLGAGCYGGFTDKTCLRARTSSTGIDGPQVDLIERCDFFGWGGDVIKSTWGGAIRLCYFDTAINLPVGTAKWNSEFNYVTGQYALSSDGKYAYSASTAGSNKALPNGKSSNSNWQNRDPHSDTINPFYQFDSRLLIEACYINRLESTRAVDPGKPRAVGINNGVRAIRDTGATKPINQIDMVNLVITKTMDNQSYPIQFEDLKEPNVAICTLQHSWIGSTGSGTTGIHPAGAAGHEINNTIDYPNPTGPSAGCSSLEMPDPGNDGPDTVPAPGPIVVPVPDPIVVPKPVPVPTNPKPIDNTVPAVVLSTGQSEMDWLTILGSSWNVGPRPDLKDENFKLYDYQGGYANTDPMTVTDLTQANRAAVSHTMIRLANALAHAVPGKKFVLGVAHESGSSLMSLMSDSGWPSADKDRKWENTAQIANAMMKDYPKGIDRLVSYWWAADQAYMPTWLPCFAPAVFRQYEDGKPFTLGTAHSRMRGLTVDHCYYDFNTSKPTEKGQGLLPRTVAYDLVVKGRWSSDAPGRYEGVQAFADDSRFKSLGGRYSDPASTYINGTRGHASETDPYGQTQSAFEFYMPTMLRAAGIPIETPEFVSVYTAPDGTYAEVDFHSPNGGTLSTHQKVRGDSVKQDMSANLAQEIFGFEIERASGGGKYWIVRAGAPGYDAKYQGTVTQLSGTKAKIVMVQPLQNGDKITYMWGHGFHRKDGVFTQQAPASSAKYFLGLAIEHVPAYTDLNSDFPFSGLTAKAFSPEWLVIRGNTVGDGAPAGGEGTLPDPKPTPAPDLDPKPVPSPAPNPTPTFFTMKASGPYFVDPHNVPANTSIIRHKFKIRIPSDVPETNSPSYLVTQDGQGFDIRLLVSGGKTRVAIEKIEDQNGNRVLGAKTIWSGSRDEWVTLDIAANQEKQELRYSVNGGVPEIFPMDGQLKSVFQDSRNIVYFRRFRDSEILNEGVQVEYFETYLTTNGSEKFHKRISGDSSTVSADPWRKGEVY